MTSRMYTVTPKVVLLTKEYFTFCFLRCKLDYETKVHLPLLLHWTTSGVFSISYPPPPPATPPPPSKSDIHFVLSARLECVSVYRRCDRRIRRPRRAHKATAPRMKEMAANPNNAAITGVVVKLDGSPGTSEHRADPM